MQIDDKILNYLINVENGSLNRQFKSITNRPLNSIILINDGKGTKVSFKETKEIVNGCVNFNEGYELHIDKKDILKMCESHYWLGLSESFNKIITHEYLHILHGDCLRNTMTAIYNFSIGVKKRYIPDSIYFIENKELSYDKMGYEKIDHQLHNIAADFVINEELDIRSPFLRAEDYNLPANLNIYEYYSILVNRNNSNFKNLFKDLNFNEEKHKKLDELCNNFQSKELEGLIQIENNAKNPIIQKKREIVDQINRNRIKIDKLNKQIGNTHVINALNKKFENNKIGKEMLNFIAYIQRNTDSFNIATSEMIPSWCKYNNRKDYGGGLLIPGYVDSGKGFELKNKPKPVVFIDNSNSISDYLDYLLVFCMKIIDTTDCVLVFYDTKIINIYDSIGSFELPYCYYGGGTNFLNALEEYKEKYDKNVEKVFIVTDGFDYYDDIEKENIFIIEGRY